MKAEEIRIGNWIHDTAHFKGYFQVVLVGRNSVHSPEFVLNYNEVDGIQITEEWLIKLGFRKDLGYNIHLGEKLFLRIELPIKGSSRQSVDACLVWDYTGRWFTGHIAYVHQLQNLYHSLTGKELTICEPTKQ